MVAVVLAIALALVFLAAVALIVTMLIYSATRATSWINTCRRCGYDLRNLGDARRCPECGHPFMVTPRGDTLS